MKRIYVYEGKRIEIEFYFMNQYQILLDQNSGIADQNEGRGA